MALLIANRGEIACRVIRSARELGLRTVAVVSDADVNSLHAEMADEVAYVGGAAPAESYLNVPAILDAARRHQVQLVHPGYGFLAENADFARAVEGAGLSWVGPTPEVIETVGSKLVARRALAAAGFPVNEGTDEPVNAASAPGVAAGIGYPVMVKAAAGGGGIGMQLVEDASQLEGVIERLAGHAGRFFGDDTLLIERYLGSAKHVELQIFGAGDGAVSVLGERDCSVQRRFQKVIEETPAPSLSAATRESMHAAAERAGSALRYRSAGTIECLVQDQTFVFLEVNARLQVEHPITEMVTGIDIVREQLALALGQTQCKLPARVPSKGHALELRICAEDPRTFFPAPGQITEWEMPTGPDVRVDAGYRAGDEVTPFYDSLLAKVCVMGKDRNEALAHAREALHATRIAGVKTNITFIAEVLDSPAFQSGNHDTGLVAHLRMRGTDGGRQGC